MPVADRTAQRPEPAVVRDEGGQRAVCAFHQLGHAEILQLTRPAGYVVDPCGDSRGQICVGAAAQKATGRLYRSTGVKSREQRRRGQ
jgi:hypothetical protein